MTSRRDRVARMARTAGEEQERARARLVEANRQVTAVDRKRETALRRAGAMAAQELPIRLRCHLTGAGARQLIALADEKTELVIEADRRLTELHEAMTKVKSLERLVERLERAALDRRRRVEAADLQDLMAGRAVRSSS